MIAVVVTDPDGDSESFVVAEHAAWWSVSQGVEHAFGYMVPVELWVPTAAGPVRLDDPAAGVRPRDVAVGGVLFVDLVLPG